MEDQTLKRSKKKNTDQKHEAFACELEKNAREHDDRMVTIYQEKLHRCNLFLKSYQARSFCGRSFLNTSIMTRHMELYTLKSISFYRCSNHFVKSFQSFFFKKSLYLGSLKRKLNLLVLN